MSKELEKLKYELSDVIDSKFEHITRSMELETKKLRTTYDELSTNLRVVLDRFFQMANTNNETEAELWGEIDTTQLAASP